MSWCGKKMPFLLPRNLPKWAWEKLVHIWPRLSESKERASCGRLPQCTYHSVLAPDAFLIRARITLSHSVLFHSCARKIRYARISVDSFDSTRIKVKIIALRVWLHLDNRSNIKSSWSITVSSIVVNEAMTSMVEVSCLEWRRSAWWRSLAHLATLFCRILKATLSHS